MKLDIGCGPSKKRGFIGIDSVHWWNVDIIHDVRNGLPFANDSVDEVYSSHLLEHLDIQDVVKLMVEIHRVCKPNALVEIRVPHFSGFLHFNEYHKIPFRYISLGDFIEGGYANYPSEARFVLLDRRINFVNRHSPKLKRYTKWFIWNYPIEWIVNKIPMIYELTGFRNLFPAWEIIFLLKVKK